MVQSMELGSEVQQKTLRSRVRIHNQLLRLGLCETLCTYVMMAFGLCSVAQVVTGRGEFGHYISINLSFGLAVALGVHVGGGVSGAHMNAAVSFSSCVFGMLSWKLLPLYVTAQFVGSFLAAATVYAVYYEAIQSYCGGNLTVTGPGATAGIFATYPAPTCLSPGDSSTRCLARPCCCSASRRWLIVGTHRPLLVRSLWSWACWCCSSGCPPAATADTPSTPPGTSRPASSPPSPAGAHMCSERGMAGGGCPWWRPVWGQSWGRPCTSSWYSCTTLRHPLVKRQRNVPERAEGRAWRERRWTNTRTTVCDRRHRSSSHVELSFTDIC
uniref:Aquaporin 7 n=1 Tax=Neogobius melanostomus TaxID=47308 RepID=A0A8C6UFY2_9GOBI